VKGSAAAKAGWRVDDVILEIEGRPVNSLEEVLEVLRTGSPERHVLLEREGERIETVLDYSEDEGELERVRRRKSREALGKG
jgi:S1-C subfamily serine protease